MLRSLIQSRPIASFFLLAFGWTFAWDGLFFLFDLWEEIPVSIPRVWGPLIAGVVVMWASERSVRSWISRIFEWRIRPAFFGIALLVPITITNLQPILEGLGGGTVAYDPPAGIHMLALWIALNMVLLGGTEEIGWRGVLQPRLQEKTSVFITGLVIGVLWWAWHLPLFFTGDPAFSFDAVSFTSYTLFVLGASVVFGAFVNWTAGSILPVMLMHAAVNPAPFMAGSGGVLDGSWVVPILLGAGLW